MTRSLPTAYSNSSESALSSSAALMNPTSTTRMLPSARSSGGASCPLSNPSSAPDRFRRRRCLLSALAMAKQKPPWFSMMPGGITPSQFSLEELRSAKAVHAFLTRR